MGDNPTPRESRLDWLIGRWLSAKESCSNSASTRSSYSHAMRKWRTFLGGQAYPTPTGYRCADVWNADGSIVRAWQTALRASELRPTTINQFLASVSSFYEFALASGTATPRITRR